MGMDGHREASGGHAFCPPRVGSLKDPPNVHFHFTPTSASWINQVEIWFGILSRKACISSDRSEIFGWRVF